MKGKIGIAIIVVAFAVAMVPNMLLYTIPAFILGAVLVILSDLSVMAKAMWTILPIAFWYPAFMVTIFLLSQ
ncbi:hypothetical protein BH09BAC1_BH09BAC1_14880 [soil metagenome]